MPTYVTKSPINHDGKNYAEGDPIELSAAAARSLLAAHAVAPAAKLSKEEEQARREQEARRQQAERDAQKSVGSQQDEIAQFLDQPVDMIVAAITDRDDLGVVKVLDTHLAAILDAEQKGKARKTLIAAIEEEQLRRMEAAQGKQ